MPDDLFSFAAARADEGRQRHLRAVAEGRWAAWTVQEIDWTVFDDFMSAGLIDVEGGLAFLTPAGAAALAQGGAHA
ncbi:hypothetical protein [Azospirillum aestuarii]|uniref:hypothetical protein n=1 Tax=Azospirillum aestuarii TaxID=2802052 RepID=UPI004054CC34